MNFVGKVLAAFVFLWMGFVVTGALAQVRPLPPPPAEFARIDPPRPVASGDKIEVIEFFYYGCPICYELEPILGRWVQKTPGDVEFHRVPALATASWEKFAKLHYTLEALGELTRLHWPVYDNFHFDDIALDEEPVMFDWVARNGIERQKFLDVYNSAAIQAKVAAARDMVKAYGVKGVPSFVVDGKFLTSASMAGGPKALMPLVDRLIDRARKERAR